MPALNGQEQGFLCTKQARTQGIRAPDAAVCESACHSARLLTSNPNVRSDLNGAYGLSQPWRGLRWPVSMVRTDTGLDGQGRGENLITRS